MTATGDARPPLARVVFEPDQPDTDLGRETARSPAPDRGYFIAFTARSGSSWLSDLLSSHGGLGNPREYFNPSFVPVAAKRLGARDASGYAALSARRTARAGVHGVKLTSDHAARVFGSVAAFLDLHPGYAALLLLRRDIIRQAVSLYLMRFQAQVHRIEGQGGDRIEDAPYDGDAIRHLARQLARQEADWDAALEGRSVLRLCQEHALDSDPAALVARIAAHVGVPQGAMPPVASRHRKIGTDLNQRMAVRFQRENAGFVDALSAARRDRLSRLEPPLG